MNRLYLLLLQLKLSVEPNQPLNRESNESIAELYQKHGNYGWVVDGIGVGYGQV